MLAVIPNIEILTAALEAIDRSVFEKFIEFTNKLDTACRDCPYDITSLQELYAIWSDFAGEEYNDVPSEPEEIINRLCESARNWKMQIVSNAGANGWTFDWSRALETVYRGYLGKDELDSREIATTKSRYQRMTWASRLLKMAGKTDERVRNFLLWVAMDAFENYNAGESEVLGFEDLLAMFDDSGAQHSALDDIQVTDDFIAAMDMIPVPENTTEAVYSDVSALASVYENCREVLCLYPGSVHGRSAYFAIAEDFTQLITGKEMTHIKERSQIEQESLEPPSELVCDQMHKELTDSLNRMNLFGQKQGEGISSFQARRTPIRKCRRCHV